MSIHLKYEIVPIADLAAKRMNFDSGAYRPLILIVDDEQVIADTLAAILQSRGYACMVAYDGKSALEIALSIPPQLLLTDVAMPGMNGLDLAMDITSFCPDCKVLLFSGHAAAADLVAEAPYRSSKFPLLSKPLHPRELVAHVFETLSNVALETPIFA